jgi:SAM-dependent methyltransferase
MTPDQIRNSLPDKRWYEYAYHKFFNPTVNYADWQPWDQWDYPEKDLDRFGRIITNNLKYIKDQRVLDVACHLGYLSLFCLHNGSTHVTGTNVREIELGIADEICNLAGYKNASFENVNLYNQQRMKELYNSHDTVLLSGIVYHINNHYQLIEDISDSTAKTIIIESEIYPSDDPVVHWITEETAHSTRSYSATRPRTLVGVPSLPFLIKILEYFNWHVDHVDIFDFDTNISSAHTYQRGVVVAVR